MNYYFYFIAQLIWIIVWLKFLDYLHETSRECKRLLCKLDWYSSKREIDLYEIIRSSRKEGKSLREEVVNAFAKGRRRGYRYSRGIDVSAKNIQVAITDWYDKVYLLIPKIHKCHDIYLPLPLWDEILRQYTHSYNQIMEISSSNHDKNKNRDNRKNSDDDSDTDDDRSSSEEEEEQQENEVALDKLKQELGYDEFDFFKEYYNENISTSKSAQDITRFVCMATFLTVYGIFRFIFDIALFVIVIIYVLNDKELYINADGWQQYKRLIAAWGVTVLYPNFLSIDYLFTNVMLIRYKSDGYRQRYAAWKEYPLILKLFCCYQWGKIILLVCFVSFPIMVFVLYLVVL